jgi:diguanylate cyclase (GGDEF)-like protein
MTARRPHQEELERLGRALRTLSGSNRALLRVENGEPALLQEICRVVVEEAGYRSAFVGRAEDDAERTITPIAQAGAAQPQQELWQLTWADTEQGRSATGAAIRTGRPVVVNDLETGALSSRWREFGRSLGVGAILSLPLHVDGRVFGALTILAPEAHAFCEVERAPLLEAAEDLSFGLRILRARERHAAADAAVRRMTLFDPVSGLPNRAQLRGLLADAIAAVKERHQPLALMRIELERYREIEEALGDEDADRLVREVAGRLRAIVEPTATLAHVSEAEFAIVLAGAGAEQARQVAQRIVDALVVHVEIGGLLLDARACIGASLFPGHGSEAEILMRRAGNALGHARRSGVGLAFFRDGLDRERGHHIALMADLRRAIERDELRLFCQPKLRLNPRGVCGAEALVRWHHPTLGLLNPGEFIAMAESSGLITPLTHWVIDAALRQGYEWREQGIAHPLAINLSARDLRDPRLLDRIGDELATWGARPGSIEFELTESALMEDPAAALETLKRLKRLDVSLVIDDYGTGYSSLSYLRRLPVDAIKIDQSFVTGMSANRDAATIVRSTIELAHNLDLKVIAEGVEDQQTFDALADWGCDMAQGYAISRPMPAGDFGAWAQALQ